jgi:multicomponent Na+:H+ antiporter subunit A
VIGVVVALHAVLALLAGLLGRRLGRSVLWLAAVGPAVAVGATAALTGRVTGGTVVTESYTWVPGLDLTLDLRLDGFGLLFWWLIAGIGLLVMVYATRYFGKRNDLGLFTAMLVLFAGAMLLLTAADNLLLLFFAWEATSITSYLLIGFKDEDATARASALQALLVTGAGGLALLAGLVALGVGAGTYSLSEILASPPTGGAVEFGLALVLLGAATKSAQAPFHFWLPGAMAAPTPVSAYLHSATMVKAGVYLIARLAPSFGPIVEWWQPAVIVLGSVSMLLGGYRALRATDLKSLLAYGTVSQLGFIIVLVGAGDGELTHAGVALLFAHALFKAALFLTVGVVDHQAHTRDIRRLNGLSRVMPVTAVSAGLAVASMAGVFPLLGFVAKEAALESSIHVGLGGGVVTAVIVTGAVLTAAYGLRLWWGAFARKPEEFLIRAAVPAETVTRPKLTFELPAIVLVVLTAAFGLWIVPADRIVAAASRALDAGTEELYLKLWHGVNLPLVLSLLALAGGVALFRWPGVIARLGAVTQRVPDASRAYRRSLYLLNEVADRVTAVVQPGSLPFYGGVLMATVLVLPGWAVLRGWQTPGGIAVMSSPLQAGVALLVLLAALGTARVRHRLSAVLLLGAVGYGVAVLFVIQGAPDLALTQMLIETLALGIFVLVLRRLPPRFESTPWRFGQTLRITLSVGIGLFVGTFALLAAAARREGTAAVEYLARANPDGGGNNVVNVILTDFRALDTLGEITVLVVAAIGIAALVRTPSEDGGDE